MGWPWMCLPFELQKARVYSCLFPPTWLLLAPFFIVPLFLPTPRFLASSPKRRPRSRSKATLCAALRRSSQRDHRLGHRRARLRPERRRLGLRRRLRCVAVVLRRVVGRLGETVCGETVGDSRRVCDMWTADHPSTRIEHLISSNPVDLIKDIIII